MKTKILVAFGFVVASATAVLAEDPISQGTDGFAEWGKAAGWTIYTDASKESCLMQKTNEGGHVVQIGTTKNKKHTYLGAFAKIPAEFKGNKHTEKVTLVVGDDAVVSKRIKRWQRNADTDYTGAYVEADSMDYWSQHPVAVQSFDYEGELYILEYDLAGVGEAAASLATCDAELSS